VLAWRGIWLWRMDSSRLTQRQLLADWAFARKYAGPNSELTRNTFNFCDGDDLFALRRELEEGHRCVCACVCVRVCVCVYVYVCVDRPTAYTTTLTAECSNSHKRAALHV
jgi:hypothetical protein